MRDMKLSDRLIQRFTFSYFVGIFKTLLSCCVWVVCKKVAYKIQRLHRCK